MIFWRYPHDLGNLLPQQVARIRRVQFLEMELEAVFAERRSVGR